MAPSPLKGTIAAATNQTKRKRESVDKRLVRRACLAAPNKGLLGSDQPVGGQQGAAGLAHRVVGVVQLHEQFDGASAALLEVG